MAGVLTLEVVTAAGHTSRVDGCDEVVVRRRETRFERGSEIAVFPGHAPLLVRMAACDVRYTRHGVTRTFHVGDGLAEVYGDHVTLLVSEMGQGSGG